MARGDVGYVVLVYDSGKPAGLFSPHSALKALCEGKKLGEPVLRHCLRLQERTGDTRVEDVIKEGLPAVAVVDDDGTLLRVLTDLDICRAALRESLAEKVDLHAVVKTAFKSIWVTDGEGVTLRTSPEILKHVGQSESQVVGRKVSDLVKEGLFRPSATMEVLRSGRPERVVQETCTGKKFMVLATPIFDSDSNIVRVVSAAQEITEVDMLRRQLKETEELLRRYQWELAGLRREWLKDSDYVVISKRMTDVWEMAQRVADVDTTVLILGESGVGKEVMATAIHRMSSRGKGPFVKVNCGAIPENLLESELFGYEKGAFTGANKEGKAGIIEMAHKGTLFLDEVADLPKPLQVKLLHFLQEHEFTRIGGINPISVDTRVVAATNRDLEKMIWAGQFREDLFYRLNVVPLVVPPLRERKADIPALVQTFLARYEERYGRVRRVSQCAMDRLVDYMWPGNVRELENLIERLAVTTTDTVIDVGDLPESVTDQTSASGEVSVHGVLPLREAVAVLESKMLRDAMEQEGSTRKAAKRLRVDQSTVVRKLQRYGIEPTD
jgi:PAS domain S-box-containing protein